MTSREIYSKGLIAGLTYTEMKRMEPGCILDMFVWRTKYDLNLAKVRLAGSMLR